MPKVRAREAMQRIDCRRPKLRDVVARLIAIKLRTWPSESAFFDAWGEARRQVYRTYEWDRFRMKVYQRSRNVCECCKQQTAKEIHHRVRVYDDPTRIVELRNVLHVCTDCHSAAHNGAYG